MSAIFRVRNHQMLPMIGALPSQAKIGYISLFIKLIAGCYVYVTGKNIVFFDKEILFIDWYNILKPFTVKVFSTDCMCRNTASASFLHSRLLLLYPIYPLPVIFSCNTLYTGAPF